MSDAPSPAKPSPAKPSHRGLIELSKLRLRSQIRKIVSTLKTPKGILLAIFMLSFVGMVLGPRMFLPDEPRQALTAATSRYVRPATLFLIWIASLVGARWRNPMAFSMAEVDFLFPGPFGRRQLLVYKLLTSALGPLSLAIMAPLIVPFAWAPAAIVGVLLLALFMQWFAIAAALVLSWAGEKHPLLPYLAAAALVGAVAGSLWHADVFADGLRVIERLQRLEDTGAVRVALAPFVVFSETILARSAGDLAQWSLAALAIVLAVAACIVKLDEYFVEASLEASRRRFETLERLKSSGGTSAFRLAERPRISLPTFPRLAGIGPIAWRQALETMRRSGGVLLIVALPTAIALASGFIILSREKPDLPIAIVALGVTLLVGLLTTSGTSLALRADLDYIDTLKSLPLGSGTIVCGSIAAGLLYVLVLQLIANVVLAVILGYGPPTIALAVAGAIPVNLLLIASDSVLVLLFPSIREFTPGDFFVGLRIMLVNLAKMLFVLVGVAVAGVTMLAIRFGFTESPAALLAVGAAVLVIEGLATVWVVGLLFAEFDPSAKMVEAE